MGKQKQKCEACSAHGGVQIAKFCSDDQGRVFVFGLFQTVLHLFLPLESEKHKRISCQTLFFFSDRVKKHVRLFCCSTHFPTPGAKLTQEFCLLLAEPQCYTDRTLVQPNPTHLSNGDSSIYLCQLIKRRQNCLAVFRDGFLVFQNCFAPLLFLLTQGDSLAQLSISCKRAVWFNELDFTTNF